MSKKKNYCMRKSIYDEIKKKKKINKTIFMRNTIFKTDHCFSMPIEQFNMSKLIERKCCKERYIIKK